MPSERVTTAIVVDDFGVDFDHSGDMRDFEVFAETFVEQVRAKNRSQWALGDLYAFANPVKQSPPYEVSIEELLAPSDLSMDTIRNYSIVTRAWPKRLRIVPVSFSHYMSAVKLVKSDPASALRLLEQAKEHGMDRNWVRDEAKKLLKPDHVDPAKASLMLVARTLDNGERVFAPTVNPPTWVRDGDAFEVTIREKAA